MEYQEFYNIFKEEALKLNIVLSDKKIEKFYTYMNLLLEWNEKINLTAITDPIEIIIKHFIDSITISKKIKEKSKIIDIGTGAGFPGIPLKIYDDSLNVTLLDSLNKRVIFLQEVALELELENVEIIHGRAEDYAHNKNYREKYDFAISRAVAPLNILSEYLIPYIKVRGHMIAMKGSNVEEEIENANNALKKLKSEIVGCEKISLPENRGERAIIEIEKINATEKGYPRKAGMPKKNPL